MTQELLERRDSLDHLAILVQLESKEPPEIVVRQGFPVKMECLALLAPRDLLVLRVPLGRKDRQDCQEIQDLQDFLVLGEIPGLQGREGIPVELEILVPREILEKLGFEDLQEHREILVNIDMITLDAQCSIKVLVAIAEKYFRKSGHFPTIGIKFHS